MTLFFSPVKRALHASVARPHRGRIFREIPRASAATRVLVSNGLSAAVDETAVGVAAGRIGEVVIGEDAHDSNAAGPVDRGMTGAIRAATQVPPGVLS